MKKHLLTLAMAVGILGSATAQVCTYYPNPCQVVSPNPGCFNPNPMEVEAGVPMGTGVNSLDQIQFKLLQQVPSPLGNVTVQKIKVTSIQSIPAGLSWIPGQADSTFLPDPVNMPGLGPVGCIKITGTPTTPNTINDSITVNVNVTVQTNFGPITQPQTFKYLIKVNAPTVGTDKATAAAFNFVAYPNPVSNKVTLSYNLPETDDVTIRIIDMKGQLVSE
ncbi:MAG: hypothetical protein NZ108_04995, partial [Bacteroidia bacterium]|nr:hypothetical protein [Bacteroidia bacterium]